MRLLFIMDGRSPIALNWVRHFVQAGHEVHVLSTFECQPNMDLASLSIVSVAFSGFRRSTPSSPRGHAQRSTIGGARWIGLRTRIRHWLGPLTIPRAAGFVRTLINELKPDLVHAMRIPYEGMLAAYVDPPTPLLLSVWGNDFTLHAPSTPGMRWLTRRALTRADALQTDCRRDLRLARQWGYPDDSPVIVLPAGGGVQEDLFYPGEAHLATLSEPLRSVFQRIPSEAEVVVNPRGFRAYVRNDTFFRSIPSVLEANPDVIFLCPTMEAEPEAERWLSRLGIGDAVHLLPRLSAEEMAAVYRRAQVTVSVTEHDGTPNTLLEAMACGCFPIAGDLESIREWIDEGENGLLVDPDRPEDLAQAINKALSDSELRKRAMDHNRRLIEERALRENVMAKAEAFYDELQKSHKT
jgi:glycosyltransferase involved in cell wall biosynthesis